MDFTSHPQVYFAVALGSLVFAVGVLLYCGILRRKLGETWEEIDTLKVQLQHEQQVRFGLESLLQTKRKEHNALSEEYAEFYNKFSAVVDIERKAKEITTQWKGRIAHMAAQAKKHDAYFNTKLNTLRAQIKTEEDNISTIRSQYREKRETLNRLLQEISLYEDDLELMSYGVYKPRFNYDSSDKYKARIIRNKELQKQMIKDGSACICTTKWQVEGSLAEGERMTKQAIKLMLFAFNGECDSYIAKVKWNNVEKSAERIRKAFAAINALGKSNHIYIAESYLNIKLEELHLVYEQERKQYEEKEEQRRITAQMREEVKAQKDFERAIKKAQEEETRYNDAYEKAKAEAAQATSQERVKLEKRLAQMERMLAEAKQNKERAISRAQLIKSGFIYIISNIGSFGENIYKIGMTRRLDPMDRVRELGDASVPFSFDVHAMVYSENAPELENALHKAFDAKRVNLANNRKEYFLVSLEEIAHEVRKINVEAEFIQIAEAQEYRESQAMRRERSGIISSAAMAVEAITAELPAEI